MTGVPRVGPSMRRLQSKRRPRRGESGSVLSVLGADDRIGQGGRADVCTVRSKYDWLYILPVHEVGQTDVNVSAGMRRADRWVATERAALLAGELLADTSCRTHLDVHELTLSDQPHRGSARTTAECMCTSTQADPVQWWTACGGSTFPPEASLTTFAVRAMNLPQPFRVSAWQHDRRL